MYGKLMTIIYIQKACGIAPIMFLTWITLICAHIFQVLSSGSSAPGTMLIQYMIFVLDLKY